MKQHFGNYLGLCINNDDPQKRGRVQVFIPHIMPTLYDNWNNVGEDIKMLCVGDNLPDSLPSDVVEQLKKILPWAEAASPIIGSSAPGASFGSNYNQSPAAVPQVAPGSTNSYITGTPWSAGFISYVAATNSNTFPSAGAHTSYAQSVKNGQAPGWIALDPATTTLQPGDILIKNRSNNNNTFNSTWSGESHGDVIISTNGTTATAIGGNVGNTVSQYNVSRTDSFAVLRATDSTVASNMVTTAQNQYNTWSSNGWTETSPGALNTIGQYYAAGKLQVPAGVSLETTNTSGQAATYNTFSSSNPGGDNLQYGTAAIPTVQATQSGDPTTDAASAFYSSKLSQDRQNYFSEELARNPQLINDLYTRASREVGNNPISQQMFIETVANRAMFSGTSLNTKLNQQSYFASSFAPGSQPPASFVNTVNAVFQNGSNLTNLATDNASEGVAARRQAAGVTGAWLGGGVESEFYYRSDAIGTGYATEAGKRATNYANTNGIGFDPASNPYKRDPSPSSMVNLTDPHGATSTFNNNNMAKGMFSYPSAGAVLWVFFREGDPLFPVYFAASFGESEWKSAYRQGSDAPGYAPAGNAPSIGGNMNLGVGGIRWEDTTVPSDNTKSQKSFMLYGNDGSNIFFNDGYHQIFSKFDRRDQVDGDRFHSTLGNKEEWVQGDSNSVHMGDHYVKVGNISPSVVTAMNNIHNIIKEIMKPLAKSDYPGPSSTFQSNNRYVKDALARSVIDKTTPKGPFAIPAEEQLNVLNQYYRETPPVPPTTPVDPNAVPITPPTH